MPSPLANRVGEPDRVYRDGSRHQYIRPRTECIGMAAPCGDADKDQAGRTRQSLLLRQGSGRRSSLCCSLIGDSPILLLPQKSGRLSLKESGHRPRPRSLPGLPLDPWNIPTRTPPAEDFFRGPLRSRFTRKRLAAICSGSRSTQGPVEWPDSDAVSGRLAALACSGSTRRCPAARDRAAIILSR